MSITRKQFFAATGFEPEQDDLERCNCLKAGEMGHTFCGWDKRRNMPRFIPATPHELSDSTLST